ncbi:MAG TPA: class I SAM-dependent methyltransferase [Coleofasciculaceae cyanobacterium]|jgi:SAM-dependent methyltransferase
MISDLQTTPIKIGSCGEPCNECDEPCEERCADQDTKDSVWSRFLKASLFNTLDLCFDDVYQEPKKILIVGGCRQLDLSQHIALLLPAAEIVLVDPDEAETKRAEEEICCRFKFVAAPLEQLPFENETFDLTIAHNFVAYSAQWEKALSEISRVTGKNLFLSVHRPLVWNMMKGIGGLSRAMRMLGTELPDQLPGKFELLTHMRLYTKLKTRLTPFPWTVYMTEMRPMREEKLVLTTP